MTRTDLAAELLAAYDEQLRTDAEVPRARAVQRHGPLLWALLARGGFVTYRDLDGAEGVTLDRLIADTVAHYAADTEVARFEWKTRGHDRPADLGERLRAHGLVPEEVETVMVGAAAELAVSVPQPDGVVVRRAGDGAPLVDDVRRVLAMQAGVFGRDAFPDPVAHARGLAASEGSALWLAEAGHVGGEVVSGGRVEVVPGTDFAGLWGGATLPGWRGRGVYRALVAARARFALDHGARLLNSDCSAMSRPILERGGLLAVTTTTPYIWRRRGAAE